ncbi:hypothetical protein GCM10009623_34430 [Nocardioides aestuarii]|uniref:Uncharacterized protein n=1 Tax=Nocardioides aestuarii TaxID=252231 RepID=A0ABW4TPK2_9ACTN
MSRTQRRTRAVTMSLRALATAVALTTLMSSCGEGDTDADLAAPTATAEAGTPTASESTDAACQSVLDDAAAEAAALRASNLTAIKVTRSADKLNTVVDQAAADCELAVCRTLRVL